MKFEVCHPINAHDFERIDTQLNGKSRKETWTPIEVELHKQDEKGNNLLPSDCPWLGSNALIFTNKATQSLKTLIDEYGELLPLSCESADLRIYNVTHVVDALNEDLSSVLRLSSGRIFEVTKYEFRAQSIEDVDIFKIPNLRVSPIFVSDRFVEIWNRNDLRGIEFNEIWSFARS